MLNITVEDIDLDRHLVKGGLKTNAGRNRVVPIHPCIEELIRARIGFKRERRAFQNAAGVDMTYSMYHDLFA